MDNEYISVSELNKNVRKILEKDSTLRKVYLKGEISNFKQYPGSGYLYFTLKDDKSSIAAVMSRNYARNIKFTPKDGMKVLVRGMITLYEKYGKYQIAVQRMTEDGLGNLYIAFEQLKRDLNNEGLFKEENKKAIPKYPKRIGVISSEKGAAIKDVISTIKRRWPICEILLFPSLVQGDTAGKNIVKQIKKSDDYNLDTLIICRGGGSIEDLWAFNEEVVARAIYKCKTPVISGVGHETDYTICDFVADKRAPTPTGAAELAVPLLSETKIKIDNLKTLAKINILNNITHKKQDIDRIKNKTEIRNPYEIYERQRIDLDMIIEKLKSNSKSVIYENRNQLNQLKHSYIIKQPEKILEAEKIKIENYIEKLEILNPLSTLKRGYTISKKNKKVLTSSKDIKKDDEIEIEFKDGTVNTKVI